jgi:hypothetical protein
VDAESLACTSKFSPPGNHPSTHIKLIQPFKGECGLMVKPCNSRPYSQHFLGEFSHCGGKKMENKKFSVNIENSHKTFGKKKNLVVLLSLFVFCPHFLSHSINLNCFEVGAM